MRRTRLKSGRDVRTPAGETLRTAEHRRFRCRGQSYLFDVEALTVLASEPVDHHLLLHASGGATAEALVAAATAQGHDARAASARVAVLATHRFLLSPGEEPEKAPLRDPSGHVTFMVNVSQRCNLTCRYCYVNRGRFDYPDLPLARMAVETAEGLVNGLHELFPGFETYAFHFYGGEPLLNVDAIRRVVSHAEARARATGTRTEYYVTTNGTLCDRQVADFFDGHRFTVYYSIDGDAETHDQERRYADGRASHADVAANLAYLRTRPGIHLIGSSVVRSGVTLESAMSMLASHGANQCKAERVRMPGQDSLALTGNEHERYLSDIEGLVDHYVAALTARRKPMDFRLSAKILQLLTRSRRDFFCPAGDGMFGIASNGELYPCALHVGRPQSRLGHISTGLDQAAHDSFRARFSTDAQSECRTCWTRRLCGGGCSAMVDRFGHDDCHALRAESEAAIAVYQHFAETDPTYLYGLVSPKVVEWLQDDVRADGDDLAEGTHAGPDSRAGDTAACAGTGSLGEPVRLRVLP